MSGRPSLAKAHRGRIRPGRWQSRWYSGGQRKTGKTVQMGLITRRSWVQIPPPPLSNRWLARFVHRAQAPGQRFRVWGEVEGRRFSGLFIGTYSAVPYAALCRMGQRVRPVRCAFAVESSVEIAVHRAAQGMPYAVALLNSIPGGRYGPGSNHPQRPSLLIRGTKSSPQARSPAQY
jgi:hypothetical protein